MSSKDGEDDADEDYENGEEDDDEEGEGGSTEHSTSSSTLQPPADPHSELNHDDVVLLDGCTAAKVSWDGFRPVRLGHAGSPRLRLFNFFFQAKWLVMWIVVFLLIDVIMTLLILAALNLVNDISNAILSHRF